MPNRRLTEDELTLLARPLIEKVREELSTLAGNQSDLHWALRRKLYKELMYDERSKPMQRVALKRKKFSEQKGICIICEKPLPAKGSVLDRFEAMKGYTIENTRLICPSCDAGVQTERGYA